MKKTIAYFTVAVFLGITLTLAPLLIFRKTEPIIYPATCPRDAEHYGYPDYSLQYYLKSQRETEATINEIMVPAVGLVAASVGYVFLKRKIASW